MRLVQWGWYSEAGTVRLVQCWYSEAGTVRLVQCWYSEAGTVLVQ